MEEKGKEKYRVGGNSEGETIPLKPFWMKEFPHLHCLPACSEGPDCDVIVLLMYTQWEWTTALPYCRE
jgi:hypothetical protein